MLKAEEKPKTGRVGQRGKSIEEVIAYAVGHRTRVRILSLLNDGTYTPSELSELLDISIERLSHHVRELADGGSIELAKVEKVRNVDRHYYRTVEMPFLSDEDVAAMTPMQRQVSAGLVIQNVIAELMAAFWAGKIRDDPRCWLAWRCFSVDAEGRNAIADEQQHFWDRMHEIEAESIARQANSGEEPMPVVVSELAFERERNTPAG